MGRKGWTTIEKVLTLIAAILTLAPEFQNLSDYRADIALAGSVLVVIVAISALSRECREREEPTRIVIIFGLSALLMISGGALQAVVGTDLALTSLAILTPLSAFLSLIGLAFLYGWGTPNKTGQEKVHVTPSYPSGTVAG